MNFQSLCEIKEEPCEVGYIAESADEDFSTDLSSILSLISHDPDKIEYTDKSQFKPSKEWNTISKIPEKQKSFINSKSEATPGCGAKNPESTKTSNTNPQLPEKQPSFINSQSEAIPGYSAKNPVSIKTWNKNPNFFYEKQQRILNSQSEATQGYDAKKSESTKTLNTNPPLPEKQQCFISSQSEATPGYGAKNPESTKAWNTNPQLPQKQPSFINFQSEATPGYGMKNPESTKTLNTDPQQPGKQQNFINSQSEAIPGYSAKNLKSTKTWNTNPQLPEKQQSFINSQSEVTVGYGAKKTELAKTLNTNPQLPEEQHSILHSPSVEITSNYGGKSQANTAKAWFESTKILNPNPQLSMKQRSVLYVQKELQNRLQSEHSKTQSEDPKLPEKQPRSLYVQSVENKSSHNQGNSEGIVIPQLPVKQQCARNVQIEVMSSYGPNNFKHPVRLQSSPSKAQNKDPKLPEKQQSSLHVQSVENTSSYNQGNSEGIVIPQLPVNQQCAQNVQTEDMSSYGPNNFKHPVRLQSTPSKTQNENLKLPDKQHNSLYVQSVGNKSSYDQGNSEGAVIPQLPVNQQCARNVQTEVMSSCGPNNFKHPVRLQSRPSKTQNKDPKLPEKQHSSLYVQSVGNKSSYDQNNSKHIVIPQLPVKQRYAPYVQRKVIPSYEPKNFKHPVRLQSRPSITQNNDPKLPVNQHNAGYVQSVEIQSSYNQSNSEHIVITQSNPANTYNSILQLPEKQYSSYYSPLERDKSSNVNSYTTSNHISSNDYIPQIDQLINGNDSPLDLTCTTIINTEINPESSVIAQFEPSRAQIPVLQLSEKECNVIYSQSENNKSNYSKSYTLLHSKTSMHHEKELSRRNNSPLDLTSKSLQNLEGSQQIQKPVSMPAPMPVICQGKISKSCSASTKKPAEKYQIIKEQNKKRSQKYRLSYREKIKQNELEYETLQEKNIILQAKLVRLKQEWDRLVSISPCFTGGCAKTFQPLKHILKGLRYKNLDKKSVNISAKTDKVPENSHRNGHIDSHIDKPDNISTNTDKAPTNSHINRHIDKTVDISTNTDKTPTNSPINRHIDKTVNISDNTDNAPTNSLINRHVDKSVNISNNTDNDPTNSLINRHIDKSVNISNNTEKVPANSPINRHIGSHIDKPDSISLNTKEEVPTISHIDIQIDSHIDMMCETNSNHYL